MIKDFFTRLTNRHKRQKEANDAVWERVLSEQELCDKYCNAGASNGGCMGFSLDWNNTHSMCLKCPKFYENIE